MSSKGKQGTKGNKQIVEDNVSTLRFYRNMSCMSFLLNMVFTLFFKESFAVLHYVMLILAAVVHLSSYYFMISMSTPRYADNGVILDSGNDLNIEGGIAEHVKDIIILTTGAQLASLFSIYFWYLLLLAPLRAIWLMWKNFIGPWLRQRSEEPNPLTEKKSIRTIKRLSGCARYQYS